MVDRYSLKLRLKREEGVRLKAYVDTVGKITIGCGRNLTDVGISNEESELLLDHDIDKVIMGLSSRGAPWFSGLDQVRQQACCSMAFNLGLAGFFGFTKMVKHLSRGEFPEAAREGRNSKWAQQVGARADVLMTMLEAGYE